MSQTQLRCTMCNSIYSNNIERERGCPLCAGPLLFELAQDTLEIGVSENIKIQEKIGS